MSKVYYVGTQYGEVDENHLSKWSIEGIYSASNIAFVNMEDGDFCVEMELDKPLPRRIVHPTVYWYKIDGKIIEGQN